MCCDYFQRLHKLRPPANGKRREGDEFVLRMRGREEPNMPFQTDPAFHQLGQANSRSFEERGRRSRERILELCLSSNEYCPIRIRDVTFKCSVLEM